MFKWLIDFINKLLGKYNSTTTTTSTIIDPPVTTTSTTTLAGTLDEFAQAQLHTAPQEVANWPIISTLTVTNQGGQIRLDVDDATRARWPRDVSINIHCLLFRNGKWHTGPCDGVRPLPSLRNYSCLCVPEGDNRLYVPEKGERTGIVITTKCRHGAGSLKFRSSIAWIVGR